MYKQIGITAPWRGLWNKTIKNVGRFTRVDCSWSQCFKNHYAQTYARPGFSCRIHCVKPLLNNRQRQKRLAWAKDKKDWTAAECPTLCSLMESQILHFFGNQGPRVWRKRGEAQNPRCLRSSVKFPPSQWWFGVPCHLLVLVHCVSEVQGQQQPVIPGVFRALHAPCCWPTLWEMQISFSNRDLAPAHNAKATSTGLGPWYHCSNWPAKLDWPLTQ